jgi:hypothetical protein
MGRRASRWPAILTGREQILGAHRPSLFHSRRFGKEVLGRVGMPARAAGYGDVLACVATLWGLSVQGLSTEELTGKHSCFPPVACAHADKPA